MDGLVPWLVSLLVVGVIIYGNWFKQRGQPTGQQPGSPLSPLSVSQSLVEFLILILCLSCRERCALFVVGAGLGGFAFCFILTGHLFPPKRPVLPDAALGYTYFFKIKSHGVYGTHFEYLAMTYGPLATWLIGLIGCVFTASLEGNSKSRAYPLHIFVGAAVSMALYYAMWRACIYTARS